MKLVLLAVICIVAPLILITGFVYLERIVGQLSGLARLAKLYPAGGRLPDNTRMHTFAVGLLGHSAGGSVGANHDGLYLHGGHEAEEIFIPWSELEPLVIKGAVAVLRERRTRIPLTVSREFYRCRPAPLSSTAAPMAQASDSS